MNNSMSLYRMELRKNRGFFFFILSLQLIYIGSECIQIIYQYVTKSSYVPQFVGVAAGLLLFATLFSFPLMMLYSWYRDEKNNTSYQILSCPIRPHEILKNKVKAFLSFGLIWMVIFETYFLLREYDFSSGFWSEKLKFLELLGFILHFFPFLVLVTGFSCLVIGVLQMAKRYRLLIGTVIVLGGPSLYIWVSTQYSSYVSNFHRSYVRFINGFSKDIILDFAQVFSTRSILLVSFYDIYRDYSPLLVGIACMYVGFFLFDRFSEV